MQAALLNRMEGADFGMQYICAPSEVGSRIGAWELYSPCIAELGGKSIMNMIIWYFN